MRINRLIVIVLLVFLVACSPTSPDPKVQVVIPQDLEQPVEAGTWFVEVAGAGPVWLTPEILDTMGSDNPHLSVDGQPIPTIPVNGGLLFVTPDDATRYTERTHVRVDLGQPGQAMETAGLPAPDATTDLGWGTLHQDWDHTYMPEAITETWVGEVLYAPASIDYAVDLPAGAPGPLAIDLRVYSHTDLPSAPDHRLILRWDGEQVGEWRWDGEGVQQFTTAWDIDQGGRHTLTIETPAIAGVDVGVVWVDGWDATYMRRVAADGAIWQATSVGASIGEVADGARLIDVSDPLTPVDLGPIPAEGVVSTEAGHWYWAGVPSAARRPLTVRPAEYVDLDALLDVDYLVVSPPLFQAALEPLMDHRDQEMTTALVSPQAIYDTFGTGQPAPSAIEALVDVLPSLRYILLVGDGSVEPGGYDGDTGATRVVMPVTRTRHLGETPADGLLGSDHVAIGRLPATSASEVAVMVDKILRWEQESSPQIIFLSDEENDFSVLSEDLATLVPGQSTHVDAYNDGTRDQVLDLLDSRDSVWANYVGHGSPLRLGAFLEREDAPAWRTPGVMVAWTCLAAHFAHPTEPSMAEVWLQSERGVVAFLGPTGETLTIEQRPFAERFYDALPEAERLGDAWLAALVRGQAVDVAAGYVILGDPAMRVRW